MSNSKSILQRKFTGTAISETAPGGARMYPATVCAQLLGYKNPKGAVVAHCGGLEKRRVKTNGGPQVKNFIPESDLLRLIFHSRLPEAKKLERRLLKSFVS